MEERINSVMMSNEWDIRYKHKQAGIPVFVFTGRTCTCTIQLT